ncbi:MAG: NAD-dependent succinate-semialdehyde dehydrogenase [Ignavibacteriales bacterium]|nr:NAD-dependent succinate-semialdehyde dehydrogenase [Ignavibacteriales bacterium]
MSIISINPATGEILKTFNPLSPEELEVKISLAENIFQKYKNISFQERTAMMNKAADILEEEKTIFGGIMTTEMGKPLWSAAEEAAKCAWVCRYYAEKAEHFLADELVQTTASKSYIKYQPLGIILAVMPWNFPFWQVFRFAAPALMAGNVGLLKHASNVPQCALAIEDIFRRAGFPDETFQSLLIGSDKVSRIIEDDRIKAITLTGSEPAGRSVASIAGKAIKKTVLELGGSDPFIVMPSSNIEEAARIAVRARTINNGQSCIAAKRFIVHNKIYKEFTSLFIEETEKLKVSDPMLDDCDIGPLATPALLNELEEQVDTSVKMGARILTGGHRIDRPGNYYEPTIITNIPKDSPAHSQELFGPVASLFKVNNINEAIKLANDSPFGLGASAWTKIASEKQQFIDELQTGSVFINGMVVSDPRLPFGGVKNSGYGRELSAFGIREFVNIKTVWIK